jgi:hypothetical protein
MPFDPARRGHPDPGAPDRPRSAAHQRRPAARRSVARSRPGHNCRPGVRARASTEDQQTVGVVTVPALAERGEVVAVRQIVQAHHGTAQLAAGASRAYRRLVAHRRFSGHLVHVCAD